MLRLVRENVLPDAHACEAVSAAENRKLPAVVESQQEMCDRVSDVPPFVQEPDMDDIAFEPAEAALHVTDLRVVSPAAAAVVPAEPGSAVWSFTANAAGAVKAVAASMSSHLFARFVADSPTVISPPSDRAVGLR